MQNFSPWLQQLDTRRERRSLDFDLLADVVVIGAGISGISTAYHILKYTDLNVVMVDAGKLAHGATGHNAGQVVAHSERPFADIVAEAGLQKAAGVMRGLMEGWDVITDMYTTAGLDIPFSRFMGYDAYATHEQVISVLHDIALKRSAGIVTEQVFLDSGAEWNLPNEYQQFVQFVSRDALYALLEISSGEYIAAIGYQKGVINSALFCEEVARFLLSQYGDRFLLFENTPVGKVAFHDDVAVLDAGEATITADRVVLCTNGFENIRLLTPSGLALDEEFHHLVRGTVSYMTGYLEPVGKTPMAVSYFVPNSGQGSDPQLAEPYLYVTRRGFEYDGMRHSLVCIGGPEAHLDDRADYLNAGAPPLAAQNQIDAFKNATYPQAASLKKTFAWHGLMGYTPNGIRRAGQDRRIPNLYYNLGCNGIGILSALFGGKKVAEEIAGVQHEPSLFDPE